MLCVNSVASILDATSQSNFITSVACKTTLLPVIPSSAGLTKNTVSFDSVSLVSDLVFTSTVL